jgi:hypothetical protein
LVPRKITEEKTGRELIVFLPNPDMCESASHGKEIEEWALEEARKELRATDERKPVSKLSKEQIAGELRDYTERLEKKQGRTAPRRYEHGI